MAVRKGPSGRRKTKASAKKSGRSSASKKRTPSKKTATKTATAKKRTARKPAKRAATKTRGKTAARKPAAKTRAAKTAARRTPAKKTARKATRVKKTAASDKQQVARPAKAAALPTTSPAAPAAAPPRVPARKPLRKAARRGPTHRVPTPRDKPARKVGIRTAVVSETTRQRSGEARGPRVDAPALPRQDEILTAGALDFLGEMHRQFDGRRLSLLARRHERQARWDAGETPDILHETRHIRASGWRITGLPDDVLDRRVEVAGSPDGDLLAGQKAPGLRIVADFEDATAPTWERLIHGQIALVEACAAKPMRAFALRPRGWHLPESHVTVDGDELSAALFDFGLAAFHTARRQIDAGRTPLFEVPKIESYLEARLWSDLLTFTERRLGLSRGSIKVTVLIETLSAMLEMDEIIFELREHVAALRFDPVDHLFSLIKRLGTRPAFLTADPGSRAAVDEAGLRRFADLCHRRGILALTSLVSDPAPAETAARLCALGCDGVDVAPQADPAAVLARMTAALGARANQLDGPRPDQAGAPAVASVPPGARTQAGLAAAVRLTLGYLEGWLQGRGTLVAGGRAVTAADAELARAQVWQWIQQGAPLADGAAVTAEAVEAVIGTQAARLATSREACDLFRDSVMAGECDEHLILLAYRRRPRSD